MKQKSAPRDSGRRCGRQRRKRGVQIPRREGGAVGRGPTAKKEKTLAEQNAAARQRSFIGIWVSYSSVIVLGCTLFYQPDPSRLVLAILGETKPLHRHNVGLGGTIY